MNAAQRQLLIDINDHVEHDDFPSLIAYLHTVHHRIDDHEIACIVLTMLYHNATTLPLPDDCIDDDGEHIEMLINEIADRLEA